MVGAASGFGLRKIGMQNIGELEYQATGVGTEPSGLLLLHRIPGMPHQVGRQGPAAVNHFAIHFERGARACKAELHRGITTCGQLLDRPLP